MNLDFALVNRALQMIGMAPLALTDRESGNAAWETAKDFYLHSMLEALAQVEWTSAKRRRELAPAQMSGMANTGYAYAYDLPIDCAKPVELDDHEYFETEADTLFTNAAPAVLLYVTNGKRFIDRTSLSGGSAMRRPSPDYISGGSAGRKRRYEGGDNFISGGTAARPLHAPRPPEMDEDFPDYRCLRMEPNFYLYWENMLAYKYALRMTDKPDLSMVFFNKAQVIGRAAEAVSIEHSAARLQAPATWQEELGLS